jgi:hypothetical protein
MHGRLAEAGCSISRQTYYGMMVNTCLALGQVRAAWCACSKTDGQLQPAICRVKSQRPSSLGAVLGLPNLRHDINRLEHATVLDMYNNNEQCEAAEGMCGSKRMLWNTSSKYEVYVLRKGATGIGVCSGRGRQV